MKVNKNKSGFTIIELMVATVVFSLVLILALAGILQVTKVYYQGVTAARTQDVARNAMDELAEALRFSNAEIVRPAGPIIDGPELAASVTNDTTFFCLGSKRYTYAIDRQQKDKPTPGTKEKRHTFWVDQTKGDCFATGAANLNLDDPCSDGSCADGIAGRELLGENMRIANLDITRLTDFDITEEAYNINLVIAYGDDSTQNGGPLITDTTAGRRVCDTVNVINEYCSVSSLDVVTERRLQ